MAKTKPKRKTETTGELSLDQLLDMSIEDIFHETQKQSAKRPRPKIKWREAKIYIPVQGATCITCGSEHEAVNGAPWMLYLDEKGERRKMELKDLCNLPREVPREVLRVGALRVPLCQDCCHEPDVWEHQLTLNLNGHDEEAH